MIKRIIVFISIFLSCIFCSEIIFGEAANPKEIKIDKNTLMIIIRNSKDPIASFAAMELQHYIRKTINDSNIIIKDISAELDDKKKTAIRFAVGHNILAENSGIEETLRKLKPESFIIKSSGNTIILTGNDGHGKPVDYRTETGTLFAVYDFLEKYFAVKWIFPGETGEIIEKKDSITFPENIYIKEEPSFAIRSIKYCFAKNISPKTNEEFELWKKRNKMGYVPNIAIGHSYNNHMKGNSYFKEHPEYYALVAGERRPMRDNAMGNQVCTSNQNVVDIFVDDILKNSDKNRNLTSLSPNDGQGFCECQKCVSLDIQGRGENGKYSDRIFTFSNEVAKRVKEKGPDKLLGIFAYAYFREPPVKIEKIEDNIVVALTLYSYNYRSISEQKEEFDLIQRWSKLVNKMLAREYHGTYAWSSMPNIQLECIGKQIPFLKANGFIGMHSEGAPDWATHGIDYYILAKLLWNSSENIDNLLDNYYKSAYGPAAQYIKKYHTRIEESLKNNWYKKERDGWRDILNAIPELFPPSLLLECKQDIIQAYEVTNDEAIKKRIKHLETGLEYSEVTSRYFSMLKEINKSGIDMEGFASKDKISPENLKNLKTLVLEAINLGEKRMQLVQDNLSKHSLNVESYSEDRRKWLKTLKSEKRILELTEEQKLPLPIVWKFKTDPHKNGEADGYGNMEFDDSKWSTIRTDAVWEEQGYGPEEFPLNGNEGYNGTAWYRCKIEIPKGVEGKRAFLLIRGLYEKGWIYVNGQLVEKPIGGRYLRTDISRYINVGKENVFAIRVINERKTGGFYSPGILEFN